MKFYILDGFGFPMECPSTEWGAWFEANNAAREVQVTSLDDENRVRVSTFFIGIGPLLYETMVFGGEKDGYVQRYKLKTDAILGHYRVINLVKRAAVNAERSRRKRLERGLEKLRKQSIKIRLGVDVLDEISKL